LGLSAFVYGGASDDIADPSEDAPFAAALRAAGARARGVVYPGEHSLETIQAHLESTLAFAGGALRENMEADRRLAQHATRPAGVLAGG
jgi:acetyl esterase/lipase